MFKVAAIVVLSFLFDKTLFFSYTSFMNSNVFQDLTGKRFGRLIVLNRAHTDKHTNIYWLCLCNCGNTKVIRGTHLKTGLTRSCECLHKEAAAKQGHTKRTHGHTSYDNEKVYTPEYCAWLAMKCRCYNPNYEYYQNYGGRGITVCSEWLHSFETFLENIGLRPEAGYSIDRINNNGNYEPNNVKWSTAKEQANNRRQRKDHRN